LSFFCSSTTKDFFPDFCVENSEVSRVGPQLVLAKQNSKGKFQIASGIAQRRSLFDSRGEFCAGKTELMIEASTSLMR
jgi:hypothetical protein